MNININTNTNTNTNTNINTNTNTNTNTDTNANNSHSPYIYRVILHYLPRLIKQTEIKEISLPLPTLDKNEKYSIFSLRRSE